VFCPNCGTQNPDAAQTCSKCSFHLKSAAAPKFKGTMLMMNQPGSIPGAPPVPPAPGPRPGAAPPPPGAGHVPSKLKGTMVGVAPMAGTGLPLPPPTPPPPPPHPGHGGTASSPAPPHIAPKPAPGADAGGATGAFSPPTAQGSVNPLGGTVAADAGVFGAFAAQQQAAAAPHVAHVPYGLPPVPPAGTAPMHAMPMGGPAPLYPPPHGASASGSPYGSQPTGGQPPYGMPPPPAPPGYATAPSPYAAVAEPLAPGQPPPGYGQSGPAAYGQPSPAPMPGAQAMVPYGQPGLPSAPSAMVGTLKSESPVSVAPTHRNPLLTLLFPLAVMFGGMVLAALLGLVSAALSGIGSLVVLGGVVWWLLIAVQMVRELHAVTKSEALVWWPLIVPFYNLYFLWIVVPQEVAKAKQLLGLRQPPQALVLYIFLWPFAMASDLNDMVR